MIQSVKENLINHNAFINFMNPNLKIEDIKKVFDKFEVFHEKSFLTTY